MKDRRKNRKACPRLSARTALTVSQVQNRVKSDGCNRPDQIKSTAVDDLFKQLVNFQTAIATTHGVQPISNPKRIQKIEATTNPPVPVPHIFAGTASNNILKDSHLYAAKRSEAEQKYVLLVELEKQLSVLFPQPHTFS